MIDIAPTDNTVGDTGRPSSVAGDETSTLGAILGELRLLTARVRDGETRLAVCGDWKFAATVVDRFCLIVFFIFTVVSTFAILFSSPHLP